MLRVELGHDHTYALTLPEADFALFDARSSVELPVEEVVRCPVLFRVAVHKSAWASGRWARVGKVSVPPDLLSPVPKFVQGALNPERFSIYTAGQMRPASRDEVLHLERCAVWDPTHVEDRLRDHYAGVPNKWVESLRLR